LISRLDSIVRRSGKPSAALIGALLLVLTAPSATALDLYPQAARSYILVRDDVVVAERASTQRLPPASLTKLLTALVVLDSNWNADRWLTVSANAASTPPTRVGLRAGEQITAGAALAAMLIRSANDACRVLVENFAANAIEFQTLMNAHAAQLEMRDSHFVDPCGFDAPRQYSSVTDLLILGKRAQAVPLIAHLAVLPEAQLITRGGRTIRFTNTNQLLGRLDGAQGLKTGYTAQAGQCLIAYAQRPGHDVWLVMLGGTQRWWQAHGMIDDAFAASIAR
jgi:serine-type D-Ala-D-Ala carboxypeptidase (penicillin-binding protein 5/6)